MVRQASVQNAFSLEINVFLAEHQPRVSAGIGG
jgi:hypothetical protein